MNEKLELLNSIKSGETVKIREVKGGKNIRNRLMEMGIIEGSSMRIVNNNGGPLIILIDNSRFAMGQGMAQKIVVNKQNAQIKGKSRQSVSLS